VYDFIINKKIEITELWRNYGCPHMSAFVADNISEIKLRKAGGHDGLQNEHVIDAGPNMVVHLACFSMLF